MLTQKHPTTYHSQPLPTSSSSYPSQYSASSQQQQQKQSNNPGQTNVDLHPRSCILRKWPHYDGYGVVLGRNYTWYGLRIGDVEPNSPAESGGLLREDVVLAVNGRSVENEDFFVILSFIQQELEKDEIRFLVLDPQGADAARRNNIVIDEHYSTVVRMETPTLTVSPEKILYDQWSRDPTLSQNMIHLGPTFNGSDYHRSPSYDSHKNRNNRNLSGIQDNNNLVSQRYPQNHQQEINEQQVYTFPSYSDYAIENGRSFLDVLFERESDLVKIQHHGYLPLEKGDSRTLDKNKNTKTDKIPVKEFIKSGIDTIKTRWTSKTGKQSDESESSDTSRRSSKDYDRKKKITPPSSPIHNENLNKQKTDSSSNISFLDKLKNKFRKSGNDVDNERIRRTSSTKGHQDGVDDSQSEPRMCTLITHPGTDGLGIYLQVDKDFGHVIVDVEKNSPADLAGIEKDDCILSLNDTSVLTLPYSEVLALLKKSRNEQNLNFLVAKKSYLLKASANDPTFIPYDYSNKYTNNDQRQQSGGEVLPSSNLPTTSAAQTLEQLYQKYTTTTSTPDSTDDDGGKGKRETVSTTTSTTDRYDQTRQPQWDRNSTINQGIRGSGQPNAYSNQQKQPGQIVQGVGPATQDGSSWRRSDQDVGPATQDGSSWRRSDQDVGPATQDGSSWRRSDQGVGPATQDGSSWRRSDQGVGPATQDGSSWRRSDQGVGPAAQDGSSWRRSDQGVGPAAQDGSSWRRSDQRSPIIDDTRTTTGAKTTASGGVITSPASSVSSMSPERKQEKKPDTDDYTKHRRTSLEDAFKPLQVGITNPTAVSPTNERNRVSSSHDQSPVGKQGTQNSQSSMGTIFKEALTGTHEDLTQRTNVRPTILPESYNNVTQSPKETRYNSEKNLRAVDEIPSTKQMTSPSSTKKYPSTDSSFHEENKPIPPQTSSIKQATRISPDTSLGKNDSHKKVEDMASQNSPSQQPSSQMYHGKTYLQSPIMSDDTDDDLSDISEEPEDEIIDSVKTVVHSNNGAINIQDKKSDFSSSVEDKNQSEISPTLDRKKKQPAPIANNNTKLPAISSSEKSAITLPDESLTTQKPINNNASKARVHFTTHIESDESESESEATSLSSSSVEENLPVVEYMSPTDQKLHVDDMQKQTISEINKTKPDEKRASTFTSRRIPDRKTENIVSKEDLSTTKKKAPSPPHSVIKQDTFPTQQINAPSDKSINNSDSFVSQQIISERSTKPLNDNEISDVSAKNAETSDSKQNKNFPINEISSLTTRSKEQEEDKKKGDFSRVEKNDSPKQSITHTTNSSVEESESDSDNATHSETLSQKATVHDATELATMPLSELKEYYDLHNIQLMQPTETSPVGLKLTKQTERLQYIITAVSKGTKAELAGLKVNDWLIKIEDRDIRETEFSEVSQEIKHLLTTTGRINMVVARKKEEQEQSTLETTSRTTPRSTERIALRHQQREQQPQSISKQTNAPS
ncbi:unnamed protein product, partial [Didymodactylos carnosus]